MHNIFYFRHLNIIGGIEQFFAYLAEKYQDWDITVYYNTADARQLIRLRKFVRAVKYTGEEIECDKAFFAFNHEIKPHVHAKETALLVHGDYLTMIEQGQLDKSCSIFTEEFDKYYGVSQTVCDSWKKVTGKDCELVYNPFVKHEPKKFLKLVYCGRLTGEKGGDVIEKLLKRMKVRGIDYTLCVYSDKNTFDNYDNVLHIKPRLDAGQFLNKSNFDYVLVPSKNEGYCYTLVQALANGLPAVITPCPVFKEIGADATNSILVDFDGKNMDKTIDQMLNSKLKFSFNPPEDVWNKLLEKSKSTYVREFVNLECIQEYFDTEYGRNFVPGNVFETSKERADAIRKAGFAKLTDKEPFYGNS